MRVRSVIVVALLAVLLGGSSHLAAHRPQSAQTAEHNAWVEAVLKRMLTIKPGMTRADLLQVFGEQGGISSRTGRAYVSHDCPYFHVNVEFEAVGGPDGAGLGESSRDRIVKISAPYLGWTVAN